MLFDTYPASLREQLLWAPWCDTRATDTTSSPPSATTPEPPTAADAAVAKDEGSSTGLLLERTRTRLSTSSGTFPLPPAHSHSLSFSRPAFKVASHLRDGLALVVATSAPFQFWTAHVSLAALQASLSANYPSVRLPDRDLLASVEEALQHQHKEDGTCSVHWQRWNRQCARVKRDPSAPLTSSWEGAGHNGEEDEERDEEERVDLCVGIWVAQLHCHLGVLRDYVVDFHVCIPCSPLVPCSACEPTASAAATTTASALAQQFFFDMVYAPQQTQLLALSEVLLDICQTQRIRLDDAVTRVKEMYRSVSLAGVQQRCLDKVTPPTTALSAEHALASWEAEREASADVLNAWITSFETPTPLRAVSALADELLRLARRRAVDAIFTARPVASDEPTGRIAAADTHAPIVPTHEHVGFKRSHRPESSSPQTTTAEGETTVVPGAAATDARKKKIRRLFS